jgi:mannose-6-phosphate isomerase-like protein (cupin superfamily)
MTQPGIIGRRGKMPELDAAPYGITISKPWGWELHWTRADSPYMGKVIHINAGCRLSLQVHDEKCESWLLISGKAKVIWDSPEGELEEVVLRPGVGYTCSSGQRHRLVGITDCEIVEVSTPEIGTTWRLEDDFGRPHEIFLNQPLPATGRLRSRA